MSIPTAAVGAARESARETDGKFGTQPLSEAGGVDLDDFEAEVRRRAEEAARWGHVAVDVGSRTPWGTADSVSRPAAGIVVVSTPGHGGVKVSPARNAEIPAALRKKSGWYEEDCESNIVGMYHPETFPHYLKSDDERRAAHEASVKSWFPDEYTAATGNEVSPEESYVLARRGEQADKEAFRSLHADQFVTLGQGDNHADWIPDGYAACEARLDDTGEKRTFLMPRSEVIEDHSYGRNALVDPARHLDVTDVVNVRPEQPDPWRKIAGPLLTGAALDPDFSSMTDAQAARARSELGTRYRFANDDGTTTTETVGEHFARRGLVGKSPRTDGDKVDYYVDFEGSRVMKVSKATYDALGGVPDTSTPRDRALLASERARVRFERERDKFDRTPKGQAKVAKVKAEYEVTSAERERASEENTRLGRAWQVERGRLQAEKFAALAAARGLSFDD